MLRLLYSPASPFARKVRMAAMERQVPLQLEVISVNPASLNSDLTISNPLVQIPVLHTPDGPIHDSRVICRFIDRRGSGPSLYGSEVADIWEILVLESMADGLMETAVHLRYELVNRPEELRWPDWIAAQHQRIDAVLSHLSERVAQLGAPHIGALGVAAALEYLDFRHPSIAWRAAHPSLSEWVSKFTHEEIMQATQYPVA